jgi:hypothetical protein
MNVELIITWQLKTVYIVPFVLCTSSIPNKLHRTSNLLNFHPALYSLTQKAEILNTCHIVRELLTKQWIKSICQVRPELFWEPTEQFQFNSHLNASLTAQRPVAKLAQNCDTNNKSK